MSDVATDLRDCPMCGGPAAYDQHPEHGTWSVYCLQVDGPIGCGVLIEGFTEKSGAQAAWNRRSPDTGMVEALRAERHLREAMERDRDDARIQRIAAEGVARDLLSAIGDWARPTGANGMTSAGNTHPLMVAAKKAVQSLSARALSQTGERG